MMSWGMRRFFFLNTVPLLLWTSSALGLSVTGVSGASAYTTTGTVTIYGGAAGNDCSATAATTSSTCNSCEPSLMNCDTAPLCACNQTRIYDNLVLTLALNKNESNTANAIVTKAQDNSVLALTNSINGGNSVSLTWNTLCVAMGNSSCSSVTGTTTNTITLRIVIDKDGNNANTTNEESVDVVIKIYDPGATDFNVYGVGAGTAGISQFTPYPGDEKIFLEDISGESGFPIMGYSGAKAKAVRVFMSDTKMADAAPGSGLESEDLSVVDDGANLLNNVVDGLTNGTTYAFRIALVDEANNIVQFFPPANSGTCDNTPWDTSDCRYIATPDQVLGLLTEDMNCFIATAAVGSSLEPRLKLLRLFRNKILLRYRWGVDFVNSYYKYGPLAARYIQEHEWLKPAVRAALWPILALSWLALQIGLMPSILVTLLLLGVCWVPAFCWLRRRSARA